MRKAAFWIVCGLVAVTPLMRAGVHDWARTVVQAGLTVFKWCVNQNPGPSQDGKREQI